MSVRKGFGWAMLNVEGGYFYWGVFNIKSSIT